MLPLMFIKVDITLDINKILYKNMQKWELCK